MAWLQRRPRPGKWRTERRERRSLRSPSELEPPEVNTTPASRAAWDTPGLSLSSPGWGEWNRARMGGSGVHSARCWAQMSSGHARCGPLASRPLASLPQESRPLFVISWLLEALVFRKEKGDGRQKGRLNLRLEWEPRCRNRSLYTGGAHIILNTHQRHSSHHTRTHTHRQRECKPLRVAPGTGPRPSFQRCWPLGYT